LIDLLRQDDHCGFWLLAHQMNARGTAKEPDVGGSAAAGSFGPGGALILRVLRRSAIIPIKSLYLIVTAASQLHKAISMVMAHTRTDVLVF
jgi:hypothetical protein